MFGMKAQIRIFFNAFEHSVKMFYLREENGQFMTFLSYSHSLSLSETNTQTKVIHF